MTTPDRDRSLEQWLRQTPIPGASADACLDAETVAAWADGVLDDRTRAAAESHAASCGHCQAMLAVMVRTAPAASPATRSPLQKWMMMLGPAVAAAAAVTLWVAVGRPTTPSVTPIPGGQFASAPARAEVSDAALPPANREGAEAATSRDEASSAAKPLGDVSTTKDDRAALELRSGDVESYRQRVRENEQKTAPAAEPQPTPAAPAASPKVDATAESPTIVAGNRTGVVNAPYPGPAPQQQANQTNQSVANQSQIGQAQQTNQPFAGLAPPAQVQERARAELAKEKDVEERVDVAGRVTRASPPPPSAPATRSEAERRASAGGAAADALLLSAREVPLVEVAVPDSSVRWRAAGRVLQRSSDAGATWTDQYTATEGVQLAAGAAPSPTTCWFVGRTGSVLVTTDGRQWRAVTFPERVDLVSVAAADGRSATVSTADGRTFATADGGATWTRR